MASTQVDLTLDVKNVLPAANGGFGGNVNAQTGTSYTIVAGDNRKLITFSNSSPVTVILTSAASLGNTFVCWVESRGTGTVTITPATGGIDGAASLALSQNQGTSIWSDGSNFFTERGKGSGGGGVTSLDSITGAVALAAGSEIAITDNSPSAGQISIAVSGAPYVVVASLVGKPGAGAMVLILTFDRAVTFAGNFVGSAGTVGTTPTATATYTVNKNGSSVGTIQISTAGVFTFATSGGLSVSFSAGDRLTITAPSPQDATLSDVGITLGGTR